MLKVKKNQSFKFGEFIQSQKPASWSSGNAFVSGAVGLKFRSRARQIGTVLPTARHRCNISSNGAELPKRNDAEMGPANSLHASAYYSEYNERFNVTNHKNARSEKKMVKIYIEMLDSN